MSHRQEPSRASARGTGSTAESPELPREYLPNHLLQSIPGLPAPIREGAFDLSTEAGIFIPLRRGAPAHDVAPLMESAQRCGLDSIHAREVLLVSASVDSPAGRNDVIDRLARFVRMHQAELGALVDGATPRVSLPARAELRPESGFAEYVEQRFPYDSPAGAALSPMPYDLRGTIGVFARIAPGVSPSERAALVRELGKVGVRFQPQELDQATMIDLFAKRSPAGAQAIVEVLKHLADLNLRES